MSNTALYILFLHARISVIFHMLLYKSNQNQEINYINFTTKFFFREIYFLLVNFYNVLHNN